MSSTSPLPPGISPEDYAKLKEDFARMLSQLAPALLLPPASSIKPSSTKEAFSGLGAAASSRPASWEEDAKTMKALGDALGRSPI